jgi:hypothetical protein
MQGLCESNRGMPPSMERHYAYIELYDDSQFMILTGAASVAGTWEIHDTTDNLLNSRRLAAFRTKDDLSSIFEVCIIPYAMSAGPIIAFHLPNTW